MKFTIKIEGEINKPDAWESQSELGRFMSEVRQLAINHGFEIELPVQICIPLENIVLLGDGTACAFRGGHYSDR